MAGRAHAPGARHGAGTGSAWIGENLGAHSGYTSNELAQADRLVYNWHTSGSLTTGHYGSVMGVDWPRAGLGILASGASVVSIQNFSADPAYYAYPGGKKCTKPPKRKYGTSTVPPIGRPPGVGDTPSWQPSPLDAGAGGCGGSVAFPVGPAEIKQKRLSTRLKARGCSMTGLPLSARISTANVARDLDVLRRAVGDRRMTFVGLSYGTYVGQTLSEHDPRSGAGDRCRRGAGRCGLGGTRRPRSSTRTTG